MDLVTLNRELAEDLIDTKLNIINIDIEQILSRWNYTSADKFVEDARKGIIEEAEDDAITLRHLLEQREILFKLKGSWK